MAEKKFVPDTEKGALLHTIVRYPIAPSQPPFLYCLQYCAIYFPHDPLYCNKILAIFCKGQSQVAICNLLKQNPNGNSGR